jgi:potassium efflux system protein
MLSPRSQFIILWFYAFLTLALTAFGFAPLSYAQQAQPPAPAPVAQQPAPPSYNEADREMGVDVNAKIADWSGELDRIDKELDNKALRYRDLDRNRERLDALRGEMSGLIDGLRPKVDSFRQQVDSLGPAPGKDQPPEPEAVAKQRADWTATLGSLTVAQNAIEAARLRTGQIINKIQDIRRRRFTERLFERVPEAHAWQTWQNAPAQMVYAIGQAGQAVANWWMLEDTPGDVAFTLFVAAVMALLLTFVSRRGAHQVRFWRGQDQPPFWRRGAGAAWLILLRALPIVAPVTFLYFALHKQELLPADVDRLAYSAMRAILIVTVVITLVTTALAPRHPEWRLIPTSDGSARRVRRLVVALALVYALNLFLGTVRSVAFAPFSVTVAQSCISSIVIALLVMAILRTKLRPANIEGATELNWLRGLRIPIWATALLILFTATAGYISLARFLSAQLIVTGTILAIVYLMMVWIDAFGQSISDENAVTGRWLMSTFRCEKRRCEQLALPVTLGLKLAVLLLSVPLILLQWGFDWKDISEWGQELFVGFRIGNTQISIAALLASFMVFALGYAAARLFQGWLDRRVLQPAGVSHGVRDSIRTGVGYIGVIIAALFAVSYAGLDLSNLALVAGALSVGIGLGLQSVVNNFVSGLILLVERPIKVGDQVVVGGEEGVVRRISVRSTEIETFDRANVLVPNAYFISETVKNWTLHNYSARIVLPITVAYGSDARRVRDILVAVAKQNGQVMATPEPFAQLDEFGDGGLVFKLYVYLYDLTKGGGVRSDLRIAVLEAFASEGIVMPNGVKDINLMNMDWVKRAGSPHPVTAMRDRRKRRLLAREGHANGNGHGRPRTDN